MEQAKTLVQRILENELIRRILRNSGYLFSATGISAAMSMFQSILAARLLGPANFGILGAITTFASVVNRFASFRMNELVVRYVGHYHEQGDNTRAAAVFKAASLLEVVGSVVAFALIWLLAPIGANIFVHDPSLASWFVIYGAIVLANLIFESANGLLQIFDRFRWIAVVTTVQSSVTLTLIVIIFLLQPQNALLYVILAYMTGKVTGAVAITTGAFVQASQTWGGDWWKAPIRSLVSERRSLLSFAFSTNISSTVSLIAKDSEVLWVSAFLGTTSAGYYKIAIAISNLLQLPVSPLPKATYPELTREIARKEWDNVRYVLKQGSRLAALYSVPVTLGLVVFGRWVIGLLYGPEYLPAYPATIVLLIGFTFVNILYWNRVALLSLARPIFPTIINLVGMVIKVGLIFALRDVLSPELFAVLLGGYYLFTVGIAAWRSVSDINHRAAAQVGIV